jgi:hypothetical protein
LISSKQRKFSSVRSLTKKRSLDKSPVLSCLLCGPHPRPERHNAWTAPPPRL